MLLVGLTGGIASGKSTASRHIREDLGIPVIDADVIARQVVAPGTPGLRELVRLFGPGILQPDGTLDRGRLAARRRLEAVTHPRIRREMLAQVLGHWARGVRMAVLDVPLLFESGLDVFMDRTLVIACAPETQVRRLKLRDGLDADAADARLKAQWPLGEKEKRASFVVRNEGSLPELFAAIDAVLLAWRPSALAHAFAWLSAPISLPLFYLPRCLYRLLRKSLATRSSKQKRQ